MNVNDINNKPNASSDGDIKKLLNAHMLVLKNKLGRSPTADEIASALTGDSQKDEETPISEVSSSDTDSASAEPKLLKLKVYYGQSTQKSSDGVETKKPDPRNILFYEDHEGKCFDCKNQSWINERPHVLDHIPSRPLLFDEKNSDIVDAILHGILDDEDINELEGTGALKPHAKKIYDLQKKAASIQQELEKSEKIEIDDSNSDDAMETDDAVLESGPAPMARPKLGGTDVVKSFMDTAGVQYGMSIVQEEFGEKGADLFAQILQAALADVDEKTRMLVRQEMDGCLAPVLDAIEALAAHIGVTIDLDDNNDPSVPQEDSGDLFQLDDENELTEDTDDDNMSDEGKSYP